MEQKCAICEKSAPKRCSACLSVGYCSTEHQKEHWKTHKNNCKCYGIVDDPESGKRLLATRDIKEGTIIIEEAPAIFSPFWDAPLVLSCCITCGLVLPSNKPHLQCPTCDWPVCSLECAKMAAHRENECQLFASKAYGFPNPSLPFKKDLSVFMRLIRACCLKKKHPETFQQILEICPDYSTREFDEISQKQLDLLKPHLQSMDLDLQDFEIKKLHKALTMNCYKCADSSRNNQSYSTACVYPKASLISHSCVPNCSWTYSRNSDFKIRVRTATAVKKGDPLTVFYHRQDGIYGTKRRQEILLASGIRCQCTRCLDPTELGTHTSGIGCSSCKPTGDDSIGYLFPQNPLDLSDNASWKCNSCESTKLASDILPTIEKLGKAVRGTFETNSDGISLVEDCKNLLGIYSGKVLHPNHWVIQLAKTAVINYFSDHHPVRFETMEFATSAYFIMCGMDLLTIQDILSPGISNYRAILQILVGDGLTIHMKYLLAKKRYHEVPPSLQQFIDLQREALKFFEGEFPTPDGSPEPADEIALTIKNASQNLKIIREKYLKSVME